MNISVSWAHRVNADCRPFDRTRRVALLPRGQKNALSLYNGSKVYRGDEKVMQESNLLLIRFGPVVCVDHFTESTSFHISVTVGRASVAAKQSTLGCTNTSLVCIRDDDCIMIDGNAHNYICARIVEQLQPLVCEKVLFRRDQEDLQSSTSIQYGNAVLMQNRDGPPHDCLCEKRAPVRRNVRWKRVLGTNTVDARVASWKVDAQLMVDANSSKTCAQVINEKALGNDDAGAQ